MKTRSAAAELFNATDRRKTERQIDRQTEVQTEKANLIVVFAILQEHLQISGSHKTAIELSGAPEFQYEHFAK
jgi:hypothetical protein